MTLSLIGQEWRWGLATKSKKARKRWLAKLREKKTKAERYPLGLPHTPAFHSPEGRANISAGVKMVAEQFTAKRVKNRRQAAARKARVELRLAKSKREAPAPVDLSELKRRIQDELGE